MKKPITFYVFILLLFNTSSLFAYIDPGSGSLLVSGLIGITITMAYALRGLFYRLLTRFSGGRISDLNDYTGKIVFFNEGKNYWNVFKPVLLELIRIEKDFIYLSADKNDPGLNELNSSCMTSHYLGNMKQSLFLLSRLKADLLVLTTPQLGILQLKRSKDVRHYCHILHAPIDIHTYKKFAFDYFDSVLCSSSYQIENLRQLEKDRKKQPKQLFETGCTYYDLMPECEYSPGEAVLLAPTWGEKSFLADSGEILIERILSEGHNLIFRPHPQSWISEADLINSLIDRFSSHSSFSIDRSTDNTDSLKKAKFLICDFSGVAFDFVFLQNKPVLAIKHDWKDGGYESSDLKKEQSLISLVDKAGFIVQSDNLESIFSQIKDLANYKIGNNLRDQFIFNFRNAGPVAAEQILSL